MVKEYIVNSRNLEKFLDVPQTDDQYYVGINKRLPVGSSNGLAYVDDGYGAVLKIQFVRKEYAASATTSDEDTKKDETSTGPRGDGAKLTHTGRLGETMKESVEVVKIAVQNYLI